MSELFRDANGRLLRSVNNVFVPIYHSEIDDLEQSDIDNAVQLNFKSIGSDLPIKERPLCGTANSEEVYFRDDRLWILNHKNHLRPYRPPVPEEKFFMFERTFAGLLVGMRDPLNAFDRTVRPFWRLYLPGQQEAFGITSQSSHEVAEFASRSLKEEVYLYNYFGNAANMRPTSSRSNTDSIPFPKSHAGKSIANYRVFWLQTDLKDPTTIIKDSMYVEWFVVGEGAPGRKTQFSDFKAREPIKQYMIDRAKEKRVIPAAERAKDLYTAISLDKTFRDCARSQIQTVLSEKMQVAAMRITDLYNDALKSNTPSHFALSYLEQLLEHRIKLKPGIDDQDVAAAKLLIMQLRAIPNIEAIIAQLMVEQVKALPADIFGKQ